MTKCKSGTSAHIELESNWDEGDRSSDTGCSLSFRLSWPQKMIKPHA